MVRGVLHAADHPGVHPSTDMALLHMGGARCHVAPGTRGSPHRHRRGNRPGPPRLAGRPGFPLAQATGRPPSGTRDRGVQPRGYPPAAPRQEGTPLPADGHGSEWRWHVRRAQPLPDPWVLLLWYLPAGTLAHATQAVKGAFPLPQPPAVALLRSLQAGVAWIQWREKDGRPSPYFPLVQGQALLHAEGMGTVEWGSIVPDTAGGSLRPPRSPCDRRRRATAFYGWFPPLAPRHALTQEVWRAMLRHPREWMMKHGARYPPGAVLEQLTAPTAGVRHTLHRASALTEQLTDEVLDLALEPLRVLYPQTHIPRARTSNRLGRLGLQRRVKATHP